MQRISSLVDNAKTWCLVCKYMHRKYGIKIPKFIQILIASKHQILNIDYYMINSTPTISIDTKVNLDFVLYLNNHYYLYKILIKDYITYGLL